MFYLVSYDIPDDRRRSRVAKTLENYGTRVQYSVFECILEKELFERMKENLAGLVKAEEDSIRFYCLCDTCNQKIDILGTGELTRDQEIYIV